MDQPKQMLLTVTVEIWSLENQQWPIWQSLVWPMTRTSRTLTFTPHMWFFLAIKKTIDRLTLHYVCRFQNWLFKEALNTINPTNLSLIFVPTWSTFFRLVYIITIPDILIACHLATINQSINQSFNQSLNQSITQSINQSIATFHSNSS
jgi:hypothetical protein